MAKTTRRKFLEQSAGLGTSGLLLARGVGLHGALPATDIGITIQVDGTGADGYAVAFLWNGSPIARHPGEFSAVFENEDRSVQDRVENWRPHTWTGDSSHVLLRGQCQLTHLSRNDPNSPSRATVGVEVEYRVVSPHVVRKQIRFRQSDMELLLYQVSNRLEPQSPPQTFWSFDQTDCQGGPLREYFPAAGFRTREGVTAGLLMDSGYRNGWSRVIRIDGEPVKPAPHIVADASLYSLSARKDRENGEFFVQQTFGEELVQDRADDSPEALLLPATASWKRLGKTGVRENGGMIALSLNSAAGGVAIPFKSHSGEIYSLRMRYRSQTSFSVQVWDATSGLDPLKNLTLYNDGVPASPKGWSEFANTVFFYSQGGSGGALFIGFPGAAQSRNGPAETKTIELQLLELRRIATHRQPYHRLPMGHTEQNTTFLFVDDRVPDTLRGYRLASQLHLADGLGFRGGETERVLYSDLQMLTWRASTTYDHPIIAPSIWYSAAGEMYLRDSFYAANGVEDRVLNEGLFNLWSDNQGSNGAINTLLEAGKANLERKSNDSTPLWLMWALRNRRRYGSKIPIDTLRKAAEYCLQTYDRLHNGVCWAQFVMGQLDVVDYPAGTTDICENQGMLAVTLRTIKELAIDGVSDQISDAYLGTVEAAYRGFYDPVIKRMRPARDINDAIGFGEVFPEFLSLWLFQRRLLTDEMVVNHLNRIPALMPRADAPYPDAGGTVRPIYIGLTNDSRGWGYFTASWHPMISGEHAATYANSAMDGIYYNGGSWMRLEVCGYAVGKMHGWRDADKAIANRLWAEIHIAPDFPTSQEYLATDPAHPEFGYHRVFAWNAFVLEALEIAGLRPK